jgi:hypothetical protein
MNKQYNLNLKAGVDFKVCLDHWLPQKLGVVAVAFGRTLYLGSNDDRIPQHEFLHIVQFNTYGVAHVVCHYLFHVSRNYRRFGNFKDAFREIPFEKEARDFEAGVFQH